MSKNYFEMSLELHEKLKGKLETVSKMPLQTTEDLSIGYTPGVAQPCLEINKNIDDAYKYTLKSNTIAVVSDGSAVLGLGDIGASASIPVMEGKSILFKEFGGVDAFPICIDSNDVEEIVKTVKLVSPVFGGVNLEDISAPRCFEIEKRLKEELDIPIFHDDQHGTAVVVTAAIINSIKLIENKEIKDLKIVINGAGAAGIAIAKMLIALGVDDIVLLGSKGILTEDNPRINWKQREMLAVTNKYNKVGGLDEAMVGTDVFIGVSKADLLKDYHIKSMNDKPVIFAMANPIPEIMPDVAFEAGAFIVGTGRSDFPIQINNVVAFPGIFRGTLDARASDINEEMKLAAARAIADYIENPTVDEILPNALDRGVSEAVAKAVYQAAIDSGVARI